MVDGWPFGVWTTHAIVGEVEMWGAHLIIYEVEMWEKILLQATEHAVTSTSLVLVKRQPVNASLNPEAPRDVWFHKFTEMPFWGYIIGGGSSFLLFLYCSLCLPVTKVGPFFLFSFHCEFRMRKRKGKRGRTGNYWLIW